MVSKFVNRTMAYYTIVRREEKKYNRANNDLPNTIQKTKDCATPRSTGVNSCAQ